MILYTCAGGTSGGSTPVVQHPCGKAAKALDDAGHHYDAKVVGGFKHLPLSRRGKRDHIKELTGQEDVPVLVVDEQMAIHGSSEIVQWAKAHPARG